MDFAKLIENIELNLNELADLQVSKPIDYGHMLQYTRGQEKATLNVYHGKKGLSFVWQGHNALREELEAFTVALQSANKPKTRPGVGSGLDKHLVLKENGTGTMEASFSQGIWAGSDESGKGDFFGPLVLSAVALDSKTALNLQTAGVKDCKLLTDKKILELDPVIKNMALAFSVLQLKPKFYNQRYAQVVAQGGKLNQLLASGHVQALTRVLQELAEKNLTCEYALVDQFIKTNIVLEPLRKNFPQVKFEQHPKAESNLAVAAASILARAQFLHTMHDLALLAGVPELPKGGSDRATVCARAIAQRLGKESLGDFVKLHFANYQRI